VRILTLSLRTRPVTAILLERMIRAIQTVERRKQGRGRHQHWNWTDILQSMVPGYRDRLVHVYLDKHEGATGSPFESSN